MGQRKGAWRFSVVWTIPGHMGATTSTNPSRLKTELQQLDTELKRLVLEAQRLPSYLSCCAVASGAPGGRCCRWSWRVALAAAQYAAGRRACFCTRRSASAGIRGPQRAMITHRCRTSRCCSQRVQHNMTP